MKKICGLHVFVIICIVLSFVALMLFSTKSSDGADFQRSKPSRSRSTSVSKKELIKQRRDRIMYNGNINNFYPKSFRVRWVLVNNRAYIMIEPQR